MEAHLKERIAERIRAYPKERHAGLFQALELYGDEMIERKETMLNDDDTTQANTH